VTIALPLGEIGQACRHEAAVFELGDAAAAGELHRPGNVEQDREIRVGVGFVLLDVVAIRSRVEPPVDTTDIVAGDVAAVLGKIDRGAEVGRAVRSVDEPLDDVACEQIQTSDPAQDFRIDEAGAGKGGRGHGMADG
jgi:hypothetical protein